MARRNKRAGSRSPSAGSPALAARGATVDSDADTPAVLEISAENPPVTSCALVTGGTGVRSDYSVIIRTKQEQLTFGLFCEN
jgi:hypothetical protein